MVGRSGGSRGGPEEALPPFRGIIAQKHYPTLKPRRCGGTAADAVLRFRRCDGASGHVRAADAGPIPRQPLRRMSPFSWCLSDVHSWRSPSCIICMERSHLRTTFAEALSGARKVFGFFRTISPSAQATRGPPPIPNIKRKNDRQSPETHGIGRSHEFSLKRSPGHPRP